MFGMECTKCRDSELARPAFSSQRREERRRLKDRIYWIELIFRLTGSIKLTNSLAVNITHRIIITALGLYNISPSIQKWIPTTMHSSDHKDPIEKAKFYTLVFAPNLLVVLTCIATFVPGVLNYHLFELILNKSEGDIEYYQEKKTKNSYRDLTKSVVKSLKVFSRDYGCLVYIWSISMVSSSIILYDDEQNLLQLLKLSILDHHILICNCISIYYIIYRITLTMSDRITVLISRRNTLPATIIIDTIVHIRDILLLIRQEMNLCYLITYVHGSSLLARRIYIAIDATKTGKYLVAMGALLSYSTVVNYMLMTTSGYYRIHENSHLLLHLIESNYYLTLRENSLERADGIEERRLLDDRTSKEKLGIVRETRSDNIKKNTREKLIGGKHEVKGTQEVGDNFHNDTNKFDHVKEKHFPLYDGNRGRNDTNSKQWNLASSITWRPSCLRICPDNNCNCNTDNNHNREFEYNYHHLETNNEMQTNVTSELATLVRKNEVLLLRRLVEEICCMWPTNWLCPDVKNLIGLNVLIITLVTSIIQFSTYVERWDKKRSPTN